MEKLTRALMVFTELVRLRRYAMALSAGHCILVALLVGGVSTALAAVQDVRPRGHVVDTAKVLGPRIADLERKLRAFETATGHQVSVLTIPTTGARSIDEYAVEVFQEWKLGRAGLDDGVLFVIAVADRTMRIEVGYGLEGTLTDLQSARIIREFVAPEVARGDYGTGATAGVDAILQSLSPAFTLRSVPPEASSEPATPGFKSFGDAAPWVAFLFVVLTGLTVFTVYLGIGGLLLFSFFALAISQGALPGAGGTCVFVAAVLVWLCGRWCLIAANVRKHHLPGSENHVLTWLSVFFFTRGAGDPSAASAITFNVTFNDADESSIRSSDEPDGHGIGGRSGGGGASGMW